jgi:tetratricopeptide (TPR) repeat protein
MREVLTSVEPQRQGADVKLIEVLAHASAAAGTRFAAHPQQEAQVRELLGQVYFDLSLWPEARVEHERARALWQEQVGTEDRRTLRAESTLAGVALNLAQYREVETALTGLIPRMVSALGADDRDTLAARRSLAIAMLSQGRIEAAEQILLELRAHPVLANDDAMQLRVAQTLIDVLQWRRAPLPAGAERDALLAEEQSLAREWRERSTRVYGAEAAITLQARVVAAEIARDQGDPATAIEQSRDVLESTDGRLPECHDVRAWAMAVLATALAAVGEVDEPADLYLRRIACVREYGSPARVALISAMNDALPFLERAGRAAEAEPLARELGESFRNFGGDLAFAADLYLARAVSAQGRLDEADALFQALLDREAEVTHERVRARLHLFLGMHLAARGHMQDAERELKVATTCVDDLCRGTEDTHPDDLVRGLIEFYEAWEQPERAEEYRHLCGSVASAGPLQ